jgi:hypothetical protein
MREGRDVLSISERISGSGVSQFRLPGMKSRRKANADITTSAMPAAPSVWPVQPFVELHGVPVPNTLQIAKSSERSLAGVPVP